MTKIYCDRCGKSIKGPKILLSMRKVDDASITEFELCRRCARIIKKALKTVKKT
jgi:hypothetical protein